MHVSVPSPERINAADAGAAKASRIQLINTRIVPPWMTELFFMRAVKARPVPPRECLEFSVS